MSDLYEIDQRLANILDYSGTWVDVETGEMISEDDIAALEMERKDKLEGWGLWLKNRAAEIAAIKAEIAAIKAEIDNLTERKKALESKTEHSKQRYQQYLNGEKFKTGRLSVSYRKSESVEITDPDEVPDAYQRTKVIFEPDKASIKDALKSGHEVPGARLVEKDQHDD